MNLSSPPGVDTAMSAVTHLAGISDPTDNGMLIDLVNWGISALMVLVVLIGSWHGFKAWNAAAGKKESLPAIRDVAVGVLAIEAFLGAIMFIANYGSTIVSNFT